MADASVEVSGPDAEGLAGELRAVLASSAQPGDRVDLVEVHRDVVAIAVIGLVFSGVGTAKTLWDWWQSRRSAGTTGATVKILLADGTQIDLSGIDREQLEIELGRRAQAGHDPDTDQPQS